MKSTGRGAASRGLVRVLAAFLSAELALAPAAPPAAAGTESLDLFQKIARADLIVHVRVKAGALKYALVDVLEAIKGQPPEQRLRIAFRDFNWSRRRGEDPIVFQDGQEEVLFLVAYRQGRPKKKNRDLFELFRGAEGRLSLPAEGSGTLLHAVRRLAALTDADPASQISGLWDLIGMDNPRLVEAALDEIHRLHGVAPERLPSLVALLGSAAPGQRAKALELIGEGFAGNRTTLDGSPPDEMRAILEAVIERARNDPEESVRLEAVGAVSRWPRPADVVGDLRAIASQDPAQMVRFEAQRALFRQGATQAPP